MIGKHFISQGKDFEVETYLGQGSFGQVYRAVHKATMDHVAIKVILNRPDLLADRAIKNEIQIAGKLNHPNVVSILDVNLDSQHELGPYIVMEFVSGGTLKKKLDECKTVQQQIPLDHAGKMMLQIAQGAEYISQHLIHRDIKPDNVLFDGTDYKITDFGISKFVTENTRHSTFKGVQHPEYMAPENWVHGPNSPKIDIYSVGIMFYEILGLKHPLEEFVSDKNNMQEWETAHIEKICPSIKNFREEVSLQWSQLLSAMTAKKAESRPEWKTVIEVLLGAEVFKKKSFDLTKLILKATEVGQGREIEEAKIDERNRAAKRQRELIRRAVEEVTKDFDDVIDEFNTQAIIDKIEIKKSKNPTELRSYKLSNGTCYVWSLFGTPNHNVLTDTHEIILCAGYIGPKPPEHIQSEFVLQEVRFSANVILVKRSEDDLYGEWRFASLESQFTTNGHSSTAEIGLWNSSLFKQQLSGEIFQFGSSARFKYSTAIQQSFADLLTGSIDLTEKLRPKPI